MPRRRTAWIATALAVLAVKPSGAAPACLSGFVRDGAGQPVVDGDLDLFDLETGASVKASGDNTDEFGFYNVCVPPGRYRVTFAPPPGTRLLGKEFPEIDLAANGGRELDVVLEEGRVVTGVVRTGNGDPLGGVDLNVDRLQGGRVFTPYDKSDPATGAYSIVLPDGSYRFRFTPPRGAPWQGVQLGSVAIAGDQTLDVTLPPGALLHGRIADDAGHPLPGIALDLRRRPNGERAFVVHNVTGSDGSFEATAPFGTFEVRFDPPPGSRTVAARIDSVTISGDTPLDCVLANGFLVSAVAFDSAGAELEDADLSVIEEPSGRKLYQPYDKTDANGRASLAVAPGRYTFRFDPPSEGGLERAELRGVPVTRDTTLSAWLPAPSWVRLTGRVADTAGAGVVGATLHALAAPGRDLDHAPNAGTGANGDFELRIPRGVFELSVAPPRGSRLVARRLHPVSVAGSGRVPDIVLEPGVLFTARVADPAEVPVGGAALRLVSSPSGAEVYAPYARTDAGGIAVVALAPGTYDASVTPPEGSALGHAELTGIDTRADTSVSFVLPSLEDPGPRLVAIRSLWPNPFRRAVEIGVQVGVPTSVRIDLYDVSGRRVRTLEHGERPASSFSCAWDGRREDGSPAPSGVYFVILRAPGTTETRKVLLVR